jgi:hypothetical protein
VALGQHENTYFSKETMNLGTDSFVHRGPYQQLGRLGLVVIG